jgi:hypothetical protein
MDSTLATDQCLRFNEFRSPYSRNEHSNLLLALCVLPSAGYGIYKMVNIISFSIITNFLVIGGLIWYGFRLFAEYHARGRWAKNATGLLAGFGMTTLALALMLTPGNAAVILRIAQTGVASVLVWMSTGLLLSAIAAFGIITYSKPLRLWHERKIERDLNRELPKIP